MNSRLESGLAGEKTWKVPLFLILFGSICSNLLAVSITDLGTLGGYWSDAYSINDSGLVVGTLESADKMGHTYSYRNGQFAFTPLTGQVGEPTGLNKWGQIASSVEAEDGLSYAALCFNGAVTTLGSLGGHAGNLSGFATAVNNLGQAVGYAYVPTGEWHPFFYNGGVMHDIGCMQGETNPCYAYAMSINERGQIVGGTGTDHAFLYSNGQMQRLDPLGCSGRANAINNQGEVVGYYYTEGIGKAFLYRHGVLHTLPTSDSSPYSAAFAINDRGEIAGATWILPDRSCRERDYEPHAFICLNSVLTDLNTLLPANSKWTLAYAFGINNHGQIVGTGLIQGQFHAFLFNR